MSTQDLQPIRAVARGSLILAGRFAPDTANPPTYPTTVHPGWSVVRTSLGLFTVTITDRKFPVLIAGPFVTLQLAAAGDQKVEAGTYVAPTATAFATFQIRVWDISTPGVADVAADANNQIHFMVYLSENEKIT